MAGSTSRIALSLALAQLQEIWRRVSDLEAPDCATRLKTTLLNYMDGTIDGYMVFLTQEPGDIVSQKFKDAQEDLDRVFKLLGNLRRDEYLFD